jgi:O-antigen ligase
MHRLPILLALILVGSCFFANQVSAQLNNADGVFNAAIRVSPSRIILGALPYGSKDDSVLTREVQIQGLTGKSILKVIDLSHAEGVEVLARNDSSDGITLRLGIDVNKFSKNQPYGIFINKPLRLETASPDEPQILIPVMGWTGLNNTERNFNNFVFDGNHRWQGIWGTPNMAGSVLAPLVLLVLGGTAWLWAATRQRSRWLRISMCLISCAGCAFLLVLLAFTYSRGAWIAFVAGALAMIFFSARLRMPMLLSLIAFALIVLLLPSGLKRVGSYTHLDEDLSVANRLKLWTGALQIMADHPLIGIGSDQFGTVFEKNYQRFDHVAQNSTAVSDYLTFGAERGLLFLGLALGSLLFILSKSFQATFRHDNCPQLIATSAFLCILIASMFSTLWFVREYQWLFALTLSGMILCLIIQNFQLGRWKQQLIRTFIFEAGFVIATLIVLGMTATASLVFQATKSSDVTLTNTHQEKFSCELIEPRWKKAKGLIVYFPGEREPIPLLCHSTLRPLAALGWRVLVPAVTADTVHATALLTLLKQMEPEERLFVAGEGQGGRLAWLTATNLSKTVVAAGAGVDFLAMDLDPKRGGSFLNQPFLVYHFLYDDQASANAAICAGRGTAFEKMSLTTILSSKEIKPLSESSVEWIKALDTFFSSNFLNSG